MSEPFFSFKVLTNNSTRGRNDILKYIVYMQENYFHLIVFPSSFYTRYH